MGCECDATSEKHYQQNTVAPNPAVVERAAVKIWSSCDEVEVPSPDPPPPDPPHSEGEIGQPGGSLILDSSHLAAIGKRLGYRLAWSPVSQALQEPNRSVCFVSYLVKLLPGTTPGLKISEVQFGDDRFVTNIAVGELKEFRISCEETCGKSRKASVTITDANGVFRCRLAGFEVCLCGTFG